MGYWKKHGAGWSLYVYSYGACMLADLQRYIGTPAMEKLMKDYARSHWYGVATPGDFKSAAEAATTKDLAPFWASHQMY
jgi:aminopeptidase N